MNQRGYSFNDVYHGMAHEVINQANTAESVIDDILAECHFRACGIEPSLSDYLDYVSKKLQGANLSNKLNDLLGDANVEALLSSCGIPLDDAEALLSNWRTKRNRFAHGLFVLNTQNVPVIYHKGCCYDIESHVYEFFGLNEGVIGLLKNLDVLHSDYYGKPVFKDETCDPDNPIYAN